MRFLYLTCLIVLFFPKTAHAYLDPATGAMIINALVVGFVTFLAFFRRHLTRFLIWTGYKEKEEEKPEEEDVAKRDSEDENAPKDAKDQN